VRIAVAAQNKRIDSRVSEHFGRARCFVLVDLDSGRHTIHNNHPRGLSSHTAGMQAAGTLLSLGVEVVVAGHIGPKAFATLQSAGVPVYRFRQGTVRQAVERLKSGRLKRFAGPDVPEHCPQAEQTEKN